jgi:tetratricopeptide (TPR) repeat protein
MRKLVPFKVDARAVLSIALMFSAISCWAQTPTLAVSNKNAAVDEMTKKAVDLFNADKFQEAVDLENQAVQRSPNYWLPHSVLSVFNWQHNIFDVAVKEADEAAKLAPNNELANLNYAQMNQLMGYFEKAIPAFRKAVKVAPNSWAARIGLSQSLIANSQTADALEVLNEMSKAAEGNFDWWYSLSVSYSQMNKAKQSADAAEKAVQAATNDEQKSRALVTLLIELIRANQLDRAREFQDAALKTKPKDDQVYVQVMSALCSSSDLIRGKNLLNQAIKNGLSNADGYYLLGGVLENKASSKSSDSTASSAWMDLAETAYRQAIKVSPNDAKFYLALAAVLDRKGQMAEMVAMLSKAKSLDSADALPSYLVSCVKAADNDLAGRLREKLANTPEKPYQLNLVREDFAVDNLQCTCKIGVLEFEIRRENGVKFVAITHREKPISGTLLVDQAIGTSQAFQNVEKKQAVDLKVTDSHPILTVNEAIKFVQNLRDTAQPVNRWSFEIDPPKMPLL